MSSEVLEYIGLDLNKEYKNLKCEKPEYNIAKSYDNSMLYKVYKMLPIKDIEILISYTDRTTEIKERYLTAKPINEYIKEDQENFLELVKQAKVDEIEQIENTQKEFQKHIPYFVRYDKNYLWQIYYSNADKKYFMLFPAREGETSVLFYLIKKKLENSSDKIYVPICKEDYDENILKKAEITNIENYIWLFTKEWPNIYEVENKLYIVGNVRVKEGFESKYRISISSKEEADAEYTLLKALFIMATESNYKFSPCIDEHGRLRLEYNNEILQVEGLSEFIKKQAIMQDDRREEIAKDIKDGKSTLEKLNAEINDLIENYRIQEKQIVMFLNCKKSFFKKLKFFFKRNEKGSRFSKATLKSNKNDKPKEKDSNNEIKENEPKQTSFNLSDLVKICKANRDIEEQYKSLKSDINAMKNKKKNLEKRVENAKKYLDEIEEHKKSIFEFWKFAKKDEKPALNEGDEDAQENKITINFNVEQDLQEFSVKADMLQKQKLSIEECNSIFACKYVLDSVNAVLTGKDEEKILEKDLEYLKSKYTGSKRTEIFGDIEEDYTKIKNLNSKKHRENKKNIYSILRVNAQTTLEDYKNCIENIVRYLNEAYKKITAITDFSVYYTKENENGYIIAEIDPKNINLDNLKENNVYKIQINKNQNVLYFSNIVYYDNYNKTLPDGMDETTSILIKHEKKENKNETTINIVEEENLYSIKINKIKVVEYND